MKQQHGIAAIALAALVASANAATFPDGTSHYGNQAAEAKGNLVVDLAQARTITVENGQTVTFVNKGQRFTWKFDSIRLTRVPIAKFAPPGFDAGDKVVYIHRGEYDITG